MTPVIPTLLALALGLLLPAATSPVPATSSARATSAFATAAQTADDEPRRFWVKDKRRYTSPWYAGERRKMINFGCTRAPYYDPDPRCTDNRGFHHGLDIAMPCGTRLFAGMRGRVVDPSSRGALGPSYGARAFRIRNHRHDVDVVIAHVRRVFVEPGDRVRKGRLIARASDAGAPDGCHLHFEVRPKRAGYRDALRPHDYLKLRR